VNGDSECVTEPGPILSDSERLRALDSRGGVATPISSAAFSGVGGHGRLPGIAGVEEEV
jgi:hypothetical protein